MNCVSVKPPALKESAVADPVREDFETWFERRHGWKPSFAGPGAQVYKTPYQNVAHDAYQAGRAELAQDAARYCVLRDWGVSFMDDNEVKHHVCELLLDQVVDAAINARVDAMVKDKP